LAELFRARGDELEAWHWADVPESRTPSSASSPLDVALGIASVRARLRRRSRAARELRSDLGPMLAAVHRAGLALDLDDAVTRVLVVDEIGKVFARGFGNQPPKVGFVVCYYGLPGLGFMLACRRRGVLTVDLQHGAVRDTNAAYAPWRAGAGASARLL